MRVCALCQHRLAGGGLRHICTATSRLCQATCSSVHLSKNKQNARQHVMMSRIAQLLDSRK